MAYLCNTCGLPGHYAKECPNAAYLTNPGNDGKPMWCGKCDVRTRLADAPDGSDRLTRCPKCHPENHKLLVQHRVCKDCGQTVVTWDSAPCDRHQLAGVQLPYAGPPPIPDDEWQARHRLPEPAATGHAGGLPLPPEYPV